jgi:hypothetical protein
MEGTLNFADLAWALGLLLLPVLFALPLRVGWRFIVGRTHEDNTYRNHVKRIIHAGMQVEHFRDELDDMARHLRLANRKSRLIEADLLYPLRMPHFLLAPALLVLPLAFFLALPVMIIGLPILIILEHILIKRRVLINTLKLLEDWFHMQIIHIPSPARGHGSIVSNVSEFSQHLTRFHKVPRGVFLGLFAWLIVHWLLQLDDWWIEIVISSLLYIVLLGTIGIISTALESDLVLADLGNAKLIPIETWLESMVKPLVGVGLFFLLTRDLLLEARLGNPVLFAATVLVVLYGATVVGVSFQWGYAMLRGSTVRERFEEQAIELIDPQSYDLTRSKGRIAFNIRMSMGERIEFNRRSPSNLSFADLENMPHANKGNLEPPKNPLK